ncbi:uncharacterized protein CMC5_022360 [Chondromyces crocatus]|uniref:Uncharacterized protein n=1 Tax=Chondromyces crocatus TaxID=52 RepID=A0A0K1EB73_CHOCO|nr:uncharacterized protein CMC5_022360 [Chondromyces crocatus]
MHSVDAHAGLTHGSVGYEPMAHASAVRANSCSARAAREKASMMKGLPQATPTPGRRDWNASTPASFENTTEGTP